jgi:hypothetical protein
MLGGCTRGRLVVVMSESVMAAISPAVACLERYELVASVDNCQI